MGWGVTVMAILDNHRAGRMQSALAGGRTEGDGQVQGLQQCFRQETGCEPRRR